MAEKYPNDNPDQSLLSTSCNSDENFSIFARKRDAKDTIESLSSSGNGSDYHALPQKKIMLVDDSKQQIKNYKYKVEFSSFRECERSRKQKSEEDKKTDTKVVKRVVIENAIKGVKKEAKKDVENQQKNNVENETKKDDEQNTEMNVDKITEEDVQKATLSDTKSNAELDAKIFEKTFDENDAIMHDEKVDKNDAIMDEKLDINDSIMTDEKEVGKNVKKNAREDTERNVEHDVKRCDEDDVDEKENFANGVETVSKKIAIKVIKRDFSSEGFKTAVKTENKIETTTDGRKSVVSECRSCKKKYASDGRFRPNFIPTKKLEKCVIIMKDAFKKLQDVMYNCENVINEVIEEIGMNGIGDNEDEEDNETNREIKTDKIANFCAKEVGKAEVDSQFQDGESLFAYVPLYDTNDSDDNVRDFPNKSDSSDSSSSSDSSDSEPGHLKSKSYESSSDSDSDTDSSVSSDREDILVRMREIERELKRISAELNDGLIDIGL